MEKYKGDVSAGIDGVYFLGDLMARVFLVIWLVVATSVFAETDLMVRGSGRRFPVAIPRLCAETPEALSEAKDITQVLVRSLDLTGLFEVLNADMYIEAEGKCKPKDGFVYSDWSVIGAEGLVKGVVKKEGDKIRVSMYLHDVIKQRAVLGKEYIGDKTHTKQIAHRFANEIMKFFTGEYGVFGTEIVFSSKVGRFKELFIMDFDGTNIRQLTKDRGLAISPSWHPDGNKIIYTSYRHRVPDLFELNLVTGELSQLSRGIALELGGEYSPKGDAILISRTYRGESDIVLLNPDGTLMRSLTRRNGAIDVSPTWSPDGRYIAFCSNRAGSPQIYTMRVDGSRVRRISFVTSDYCTSPAWSPKGDKIAFVCRAERGYQIFVSNVDGSNPLQLTSYGSNEDPAWSPNGRYLVFSSTLGKGRTYHLALIRSDGTNLRQLTDRGVDDTLPAWGPLKR